MIETARLAEIAIVYGNRFRSEVENVDRGLNRAEMLFYKGNYKGALEVSLNAIDLVEPDFKKDLLKAYNSSD